MMEFEGSFETPAPASAVRDFVLSAEKIKDCLPGVIRFEEKEGGFKASFKLDVRDSGVPQMETISVTLDLKYEVRDNEISISGKGRAAGSGVSFSLSVVLSEGNGTKVNWHADVEFGWVIKLFGEKTVSAITKKNVDHIIDCINAHLQGVAAKRSLYVILSL